MSEKMTCPACNSHTSSVRAAFLADQPCPSCGLSADAANEILAIRHRQADADLTRRYEQALVRADKAETESRRRRATLDAITHLLEEERGP